MTEMSPLKTHLTPRRPPQLCDAGSLGISFPTDAEEVCLLYLPLGKSVHRFEPRPPFDALRLMRGRPQGDGIVVQRVVVPSRPDSLKATGLSTIIAVHCKDDL
jgi:hypothetical protein